MSFLHSWHGRRNPAPTASSSPSPSPSPSTSSSFLGSSSSVGYFLQAVQENGRTTYLDLVDSNRPQTNSRALLTPLRTPTRTHQTDASHILTHTHQPNHTNTTATTTTKHAILPHMEDLDDEILALGYEKAMIAGAAAGAVEHIFMFPVDTIKTRLQVVQTSTGPHYKGVVDAALRIVREEGATRLYRGFPAIVSAAIPSHAVHFATYEHFKHRLGGSEPGHHPFINGVSGGLAAMAHDAIVTPLDVVKQRLQVYNSSYAGVLQCIRRVAAEEGLRAFYASYPTTVAMNVPFQAVHFAAYESIKLFIGDDHDHDHHHDDDDDHDVLKDVTAGGAAGALGGFVSTPLDVVKTRLQTQQVQPGQHRLGAVEMVRHLYASEGARVFMRGAAARVLYYIPSAAICWTTYEGMKRLLKNAW